MDFALACSRAAHAGRRGRPLKTPLQSLGKRAPKCDWTASRTIASFLKKIEVTSLSVRGEGNRGSYESVVGAIELG